METTLMVYDETASGECLNKVSIPVKTDSLQVKEIIALRVKTEVDAYNRKVDQKVFSGLVQPSETEVKLNGSKILKKREVDAEKQVYVALDAFMKNGYFMFIDNQQVDSLEQQISIHPGMKVSFVKLTPLVGG